MSNSYETAANALAKCAAYDPWFPQPNRATVSAWAEQIARYQLDEADVLEGVTKMYSDNGSGFRPLPKDLITAARAVRKDRDDRQGPSDEYQALCDSKAAEETAAVAEARHAEILRAAGSFGKPPGRATAEAETRLRALAQKQREASPPIWDAEVVEA